MTAVRRAGLSPFSTEIIWKAGLSGTGSYGEGKSSPPTLSVVRCIVVATDEEAGRVRRIVPRAVRESIVARLIGDCLTVAADVGAVPGARAS